MTSFIHRIEKKIIQMNFFTKHKQIHRLMVEGEEGKS